MTCAQCDAMREELHYLRGELGLRLQAGIVGRIARAWKLSPQAARLLAILYQGSGKPVTNYQLQERIAQAAADEQGLITVYICRLRKALGPDAILNVRGVGYQLSAGATTRVAEILSEAD